MTDEVEHLKDCIRATKETIRLRWVDMAALPGTREDRATLRVEIDGLNTELAALRERLDDANA